MQGEAGGVDAGMRGRAAAGNSTGRDIPSNDGGAAPAKALSAREEEEQVRQKRIKERPAAPPPSRNQRRDSPGALRAPLPPDAPRRDVPLTDAAPARQALMGFSKAPPPEPEPAPAPAAPRERGEALEPLQTERDEKRRTIRHRHPPSPPPYCCPYPCPYCTRHPSPSSSALPSAPLPSLPRPGGRPPRRAPSGRRHRFGNGSNAPARFAASLNHSPPTPRCAEDARPGGGASRRPISTG